MGVGVTPLEIEWAEKLAQHVPCIEEVLLCNSGTEATYHAIRLARAATGRQKVGKFQGCFHGTHDALAMNVITPAARMGARKLLSAGMTPELVEKTLICIYNDLDSVADAIRANPGEIAAVILEPILHNIGGVRPDLTTLGKAMASGFPIAAVGGRTDLMDRFNTRQAGDVLFAGTYNGHPARCAAALATIAELERPGAYARRVARDYDPTRDVCRGGRLRLRLRDLCSGRTGP